MGKFQCLLTVKREKQSTYFFSCDSLTIYDGGSSTSPMMGKYCGDSIPPSHVSSSNKVLIHFLSDTMNTYSGFQMEYNPTGMKNTSILNIYIDRWRILRTFFTLFFFLEKWQLMTLLYIVLSLIISCTYNIAFFFSSWL